MRPLALLLLLAVAGCVPLAENPAGDEEHATFDARLQGAWRARGGDAPFFVFVGPADESRRAVRLVTLEETDDGRWKEDESTAISARRGAGGFLSVRYATTGGERRGWVIARYDFPRAGELRVAALDEKRLIPLVRAGTVPGKIADDGPTADVDLTGSSAELLALLDSPAGTRLFGAPHTLVRVSPARSRAAAR